MRNSRKAVALQIGLAIFALAGCATSPQPAQDVASVSENVRRVAEEALGERAEIVAHGNLAGNELEQLMVINRFGKGRHGDVSPKDPAAILITRAAILENHNGEWIEVLRCDEHLKNTNGYLGGSPAARVTSWRLEYRTNTAQGLEMKFAPTAFEVGEQDSGTGEPAGQTVIVRWNTKVKRYQSLDASHERYLSESPTLETPHSILR
jgi:hypothetical protein